MENSIILIIFISTFTLISGIGTGFTIGFISGRSSSTRQNQSIPKSPIPWILSFAGSGISLIICFCCLIYNIYFLSSSQVTIGIVQKVVVEENENGGTFYYPIYEFYDSQQRRYEGKPFSGVGTKFVKGEKLNIRYLSKDPHESRIDNFIYNWMTTLFFAITSILLCALGFGLKWWRDKNK